MRSDIAAALVEKDYWITHGLWALHETELAIWFKGGTSLSKGFGIIERFSEDLDLMIERGGVATLPEVTNWASTDKGPTAQRRAFYDALPVARATPGVSVELDVQRQDNMGAKRPSNRTVRFLSRSSSRRRTIPAASSTRTPSPGAGREQSRSSPRSPACFGGRPSMRPPLRRRHRFVLNVASHASARIGDDPLHLDPPRRAWCSDQAGDSGSMTRLMVGTGCSTGHPVGALAVLGLSTPPHAS